ncbi:DUF885 domain-containing protein [Pelomonas sp. SE-A7]|uniref:DUF885 domain-containing protein n=1 Tax=Pelomonas sp. SE-A7 TaxID=3054953 RepID=UPI00259D117B|nr:DUF885 domain-containing protein [Pelomonas sp. SE-A7]MDM4764705.1 DUF885 domain-containing protein [Pelomonas sp. SE-A7]
MKRRLIAPCLLSLAALMSSAQAATPTEQMHALFQRSWEQDLARDPLSATYYGERRLNGQLPELSLAHIEEDLKLVRERLAALRAIPKAKLPPAEQLNHELFERELQEELDAAPFKLYLEAIGPRGGVQTAAEWAENMPFETLEDYRNWLSRLRALPRYIAQTQALLQQGMAERRVPPRVLMTRVQEQLNSLLAQLAKPEDSSFYKRFKTLPASVSAEQGAALRAEALTLIEKELLPAYRSFASFFSQQYLPACRETVGAWDLPEGGKLYANRARHYTTTSLAPEQIHEIGLKEVARIEAEMDSLTAEIGYKGTRAEFFNWLRTDPQHFFSEPQKLYEAYVLAAKKIEPELPKLFGKLYRTPFGVRAIPDITAPHTYTAYYSPPSLDGRRAGYYYVNLYRPEVRPKWEIEVLTVHESVPGHHLQVALANELGELPPFRRRAGYTSFVEGWALYSERLGYELGLYKDPYSRFGQLSYDMWRAVRLVVDTGLHLKRWSRQQAIDYFMSKAPKAEADIINEVDRYISWPGQALGYKIGQLKVLELRAQAEKALGSRFDLRAFHDHLLGAGALPLDLLERRMQDWIRSQIARR